MSEKEDLILSQQEIAKRVGCSPSAIHYIINGDREPSKEMARNLMIATGVAAIAWIFPEWFFNPYIPFKSAWLDARLWTDPTVDMDKWADARRLLRKKTWGTEDREEFVLRVKTGFHAT